MFEYFKKITDIVTSFNEKLRTSFVILLLSVAGILYTLINQKEIENKATAEALFWGCFVIMCLSVATIFLCLLTSRRDKPEIHSKLPSVLANTDALGKQRIASESTEDVTAALKTEVFDFTNDDSISKFAKRAFDCLKQDHGAQEIVIDMAGHSLWAHFRPNIHKENFALDASEVIRDVKELNMIGEIWKCGLKELILSAEPKQGKFKFRLLLIDPKSAQAKVVKHWQLSSEPKSKDSSRDALENGYQTLYIAWLIHTIHAGRVEIEVRVLKQSRLSMYYGFLKIGEHALISLFKYTGLSDHFPCVILSKLDRPVLFHELSKEHDTWFRQLGGSTVQINYNEFAGKLGVPPEITKLGEEAYKNYMLEKTSFGDFKAWVNDCLRYDSE